jgi:photosynthetic reaction center cytochrome c subunit
MNLRSKSVIIHWLAIVLVLCIGTGVAVAQVPSAGQATAAETPPMSQDFFKNVQVLRGIPVDEFMSTMGFFAAALSLNCTDCHVKAANNDWARYADDTPLKQTARKMVLMVRAINQANFGGRPEITCYSCHRSSNRPKVIPNLAEQYGSPPDDPDEVESHGEALTRDAPSVDQILDRYVRAVGGAQQAANLTSFIAQGTYEGYDTSDDKAPVEIYAKAPNQRTTIIHVLVGDSVTKDGTSVFDGRAGWINDEHTLVPMLTLTGGNLDGARADAVLSFPGEIKKGFTDWLDGFPETIIDGRAVQVVQGNSGKSAVKLYFDKQSGLLVRQVRYAQTLVGLNPTQIDYSDYRDVAGVKLPFKWLVTWTDGQSTFEISQVQANVPIDARKFAKPAP